METSINFSKSIYVVVTGASKGIGRQIAIDFGKKLCKGSEIVLMARSADGLEETSKIISSTNPNQVKVTIQTVDFSNFTLEECEKLFSKLLSTKTQYESGVIFHNAGSIGTLKKAVNMTDIDMWRNYYELNLFSPIIINNVFIKQISKLAKKVYVINITSLCGRQAFPALAMYGSGKAARDLFFSVLDAEEPNVTVLKYSPGPVKTDMVTEIMNSAEDENLRAYFDGIVKDKTILTPEQTVGKLISILEGGTFKSGDTIDYFDK